MEQYTITGMSCAACSARVEKAVSKVPGVTACSVNLLTNSMGVEGSAPNKEIIAAVEQAGYGAILRGNNSSALNHSSNNPISSLGSPEGTSLRDLETPLMKKRLVSSLLFLFFLMYFSMGHTMWNWPLPSFYSANPIAIGLTQLLLTTIVLIINQKFFINGFKGLFHGAPNMDTLVALGAGAAYLYSTYALFAMTDMQAKGDMVGTMSYLHEFYYESAAMIVTLITVGKMLEAHSKGKTTNALKGLMDLAPKSATIIRDGEEQTIAISQVKKGDVFVVRPGERIPVDGIVLEGYSAVDEAALTGESIPIDKADGDAVSAATINQSGFLRCEATRVGEDTTLSQIIQMVSDAAATKAPIAKVADKVSGVFVPTVIVIALITLFAWLLAGESIGFALARSISVLVISCPCALGLATPVAIMVGNGLSARHGIMFKTAVSLEQTGKTDIVVLDKTGTITEGSPRVTDLIPVPGVSETELLALAFALEQQSEHPLAKAIIEKGQALGISVSTISDFLVLPGNGLTATYQDATLYGGNAAFISQYADIPLSVQKQAETLAMQGKTPLFFAKHQKDVEALSSDTANFLGMIAVADVIKEDSPNAIKELQDMGIRVVMLTGDNQQTADAIGKQAGVDDVIADVLPDGKEAVIRTLQESGAAVAMVGDGINDAPALTRADVGIAIGAGTDIAIDAADIVLMKSHLTDVPAALRLSRATLRNIHENLFWAFIYNIIGIPLAAGVWIPLLGWQLNPMFGAAAMSLSSFCVVSNALRLNLFRPYDTRHDQKWGGRKRKKNAGDSMSQQIEKEWETNKEELTMTKTIKIEGMMCGHCEARVKKTLESLEGVTEAVVSHENGTAIVTLSAEVENEILQTAIEAQDYKVIGIE